MPANRTTRNAQDEMKPEGFQASPVNLDSEENALEPVKSLLSDENAVESAQLLDLQGSEGSLIFYPKVKDFDVGDVLYIRERIASNNNEESRENGLIVQIISKGIASYPQADNKALFRLLTTAHAKEIKRSYNEPKEIIDEFLIAEFIVRASIQNAIWKEPEGKVVTRNVDIFPIKPDFLARQIIQNVKNLNLFLGSYKKQKIHVYAGGFEKVNLITGMKGGGKSHITKGIIHLQKRLGMTSIVFDINGEYSSLPNSRKVRPTEDLKFRLDQLPLPSLFTVFDKLSLFNTVPTDNSVKANLPDIINHRKSIERQSKNGKIKREIPDLDFILNMAVEMVGSNDNMLGAFRRGIRNLISYNLFCTRQEAIDEDDKYIDLIKEGKKPSNISVFSLRSVLYEMTHDMSENKSSSQTKEYRKSQSLDELKNNSGIIVFDIGGLSPTIQKVVVALVIDQLKEICRKQSEFWNEGKVEIPLYPSVFFEEAHMYMDQVYIDELIPLIRHLGMNLFFVTNTPAALPDSVFRLVDNVIMTRIVNKKDIDKVIACGLADKKTIEGFAKDLPKYHNLFLSANNGATKNFPLVFQVRDFTAPKDQGGEGLPQSGVTRSMWEVIRQKMPKEESEA